MNANGSNEVQYEDWYDNMAWSLRHGMSLTPTTLLYKPGVCVLGPGKLHSDLREMRRSNKLPLTEGRKRIKRTVRRGRDNPSHLRAAAVFVYDAGLEDTTAL